MDRLKNPVSILVAEDDDEYYGLLEEAMKELAFSSRLERFVNGEDLLTFLQQDKIREEKNTTHLIILMDLNMPKKTGHEALKEIRAIPSLRKIPIIIMTVSNDPRDIARCYESGANSYITKPFDFEQLLKTFEIFKQYWFEKVQLPLN